MEARPSGPADAPSEPAFVRQTSGGFVRAASTLSGGAALFPPNQPEDVEAERRPLRQQRRVNVRLQMQQRIQNEIVAQLRASCKWVVLIIIVFVIVALTGLFLFINAFLAVVYNFDKPCDQPLKHYLWFSTASGILLGELGRFTMFVVQRFWGRAIEYSLWIKLATSCPAWAIIGWGIWMVNAAKTCPNSNPGLYYPTKHFIYAQVVIAVCSVLLTLLVHFGRRQLVIHLLNTLASVEQPGCEEAVHKLPKVSNDSKELIDADDGKVMECIICTESFESVNAVVRTPCKHYFHEQCLADWCKHNVDCPLCRQQIGEVSNDSAV